MKTLNILNNYKYYFFGFIILLLVVFINRFPSGYVFGGGDTIQLIEAKESFKKLFFDWRGNASIFYSIFYFLDLIGISNTGQLSFYLGIFIFGSYVSFDIFTRLIFKNTSGLIRMFLSLFYALNLFTLYIFTANWGFSHFLSLYIFIPLLVGTYIRFLETESRIFGIFFVLFLFLGSSGFGNPAFALSFSIFLFFITLSLAVVGKIKINKKQLLNIFFVIIFSILVNIYWILPTIPIMKSGVEQLFSGNAIDLNWALSHTSNPISSTIRLIHYSKDYFPDNFPYRIPLFFKKIFEVLSFLPASLILTGLFFFKKIETENKKYFLVFWTLLILLVLFVARLRPPFEVINYYIYNTWGLNTLRGYDKMAIYVPFVISVLLLVIFNWLKIKKTATALMLLIILIPLPFYTGKLQQNLSYRFSDAGAKNKDYRKSKLSFLVKIPSEYYEIRDQINNDKEKSFIATLPYSANDGTAVSSYPKWKFYGADMTKYLYEKNFIEANGFYFKDWNFSQDFNEENENYQWIVKLLGMMNSKYILYHKDVPEKSFKQTEYKMKELERKRAIKKIKENDYFNLYEIDNSLFFPYITWQKERIAIESNPASIERNFEKAKSNIKLAEFGEINPKKYLITVNEDHLNNIILAEPFEKNWKAYAINDKGEGIELKNHFIAHGYANGWGVDTVKIKKIIIEYYPVRLMWKGMIISLVTVVFLLIYLLRYYYVKRKMVKN